MNMEIVLENVQKGFLEEIIQIVHTTRHKKGRESVTKFSAL